MANIKLTNGVLIDGNSINGMDLLWTNSNPKTDFNSQTITVNGLSNYSLLLVDYAFSTDFTIRECLMFTPTTPQLRFIGVIASRIIMRVCDISGNKMSFKNGSTIVTYNSTNSDDNRYIIPYQIYGIKTS